MSEPTPTPEPPSGRPPIDPRGAFAPPPPPGGYPGPRPGYGSPPPAAGGGWMPPMPPPGYSPQPYPMPPVIVAAPPASRTPSLARALLTTLATSILGLSLAMNVFFLLSSMSRQAGGMVRQEVITAGGADRVVVLPVSGLIDGDESRWFDKLATRLEDDPSVKAVVLELDTPGGGVTASDQIYRRLLAMKSKLSSERPNFKVVASMGPTAASGGYYIACAADEIFAEPTTITGSIGVILQNFNVSEGMKKLGVEDTSIIAAGATFKDAGSPFKPQDRQSLAHLQGVTDQMFTIFKGVVETARGSRLKAPLDQVANGKVFTGKEAVDLGLVDQLDGLTAACAYAASQAQLTKPTVVRWEPQQSLLSLLAARASVSPDALSAGIDPIVLADRLSPRLLYLWRGQ